MSIPATPTNFAVAQGNANILLTWDNSPGATSYIVQRSTDGVTYANYATVVVNTYTDTVVFTAPTVSQIYYYQVSASNSDGTSPYTVPQSAIATVSGELSLGELRLRAQQRADRVGSPFVSMTEWNFFINLAYKELYDLLVTAYEDYYVSAVAFQTNGTDFRYALPNGIGTFLDFNTLQPLTTASRPFYKLLGVDLNVSTASNAWITVPKFMFINRNEFIYPNSSSTIYGVANMKYRLSGGSIEFIPTPSANQYVRLWYIPRARDLVADTDVADGINGWYQYIIVRAAKYALDKEESPTETLDAELLYLKGRIEEAAQNRDAGQADTISDVRGIRDPWGGNNGSGFFRGGF